MGSTGFKGTKRWAAVVAALAVPVMIGPPAQAREPEMVGEAYRAQIARTTRAATPPLAQVIPVAKGAHERAGRNVVSAKVILQSGGYIDWHTHPGQALGIVTGEGTLTLVTTGCARLSYPSGEAFTAPRATHTARNLSDAPVTVWLNFFVKGDQPTIMADPAEDARLDERCGLEE